VAKLSMKNYAEKFPKYPPVIKDPLTGWIHGTWMIGNNFRNKRGYYGEYPPSFLDRVKALFPRAKKVLHLFSGTVDKERWKNEVLFDINPDLNPDVIGDAKNLSQYFQENEFDLVIADPPYSEEDAKHYGTPLISRNKVMKELYPLISRLFVLVGSSISNVSKS